VEVGDVYQVDFNGRSACPGGVAMSLDHRFSRTFKRHGSIRLWVEGSPEAEREFGATEPGE
jgi:hypothetical protein